MNRLICTKFERSSGQFVECPFFIHFLNLLFFLWKSIVYTFLYRVVNNEVKYYYLFDFLVQFFFKILFQYSYSIFLNSFVYLLIIFLIFYNPACSNFCVSRCPHHNPSGIHPVGGVGGGPALLLLQVQSQHVFSKYNSFFFKNKKTIFFFVKSSPPNLCFYKNYLNTSRFSKSRDIDEGILSCIVLNFFLTLQANTGQIIISIINKAQQKSRVVRYKPSERM